MEKLIAAYCYQETKNGHCIIIITSSSGEWIIPKGHKEAHLSQSESVLLEAWEEAGIIGRITGPPIEKKIKTSHVTIWKIYPVKILARAEVWPEKKTRKTHLLPIGGPQGAMKKIKSEKLREAIQKLSEIYSQS